MYSRAFACCVLFLFVPSVGSATIVFSYSANQQGGPGVVTGTFGYDEAAMDSDGSPTLGRYVNAGFLAGTVTGGPHDGATFNIVRTVDVVHVAGTNDIVGVGTAGDTTFLTLFEQRGDTLIDDSLPATLSLSDFDFVANVALDGDDIGLGAGAPQLFYNLQTLTVPEPDAFLLAGVVAVVSLVGRLWRAGQ